ncbi:MAG: xanthine dehydrogenase family protein molybdopterin-binding subunit [Acidobacteriaceae bacterium]|nr:xanthine dehydrogenase family protein molybdopterin-binding subunit [Acidobacteriaceae bacterium]
MAEIIGEPLDRIDGRLKVTGRATYAYEHQIPNAATGVLVTSTIAKGSITSIDSKAAERVPGFLLVLTYQNATKLNNPLNTTAQGQERSPARAITALQDNLVRYDNQPVALVVAETFEAAREGAALVRVQYAPDRHHVDLEKRLAEAYTPKKAGGGGDPATSNRGDVNAGMSEAEARVEQTYWTPFEVHNPMEPHATIAVWDALDHLTLYDATQGVFSDRGRIASLFGLKPDNVRVISPYLGGGFGSKGPVWSHVAIAAMAAKQLNRPVKLAVERPQMFGMVGLRSQTRQTLRLGAKHDGTLTALSNETYSHTSTFDEFVESSTLCARMLYQSPNNSTVQKLVKSDIGTPSFMRAPGESVGTYALEAAMDEMAYALKMDPVEFRLKNYAETDPEENKPWSSKSLRECYTRGAEHFGWSKRKLEPRSMREGHTLIGWGMATAVYPTRRSASNASARLNADGTFSVDAGTQDLGTGTYTIMTQIAAQSFGVNPQQVKFRLGDTLLPQTPVSGGSQTAASTGSAVYLAGQALREKLIQMAVSDTASPLSGVSEQDVVFEGGRLSAKGNPAKGEAFQQLLARRGLPYVEAQANAKPGEEKNKYSMYAFGAQFAEVRVDADLGQMKVSRMVGCFGAGKILNAKTARSQFLGGMVWGASLALYENAVLDERLGRWVNNNLAEYHVPTNMDIGNFEAMWVDEKDDHVNPLGAKGIGEIGITGAAAAVANAVFHATGKRIRELPITPDKLLLA